MTIASRAKILAVDDVADNLRLLEAILGEGDNYQLNCVESGQAAMQAIEQAPPDLLLLDVMMPDMDGYEVISRIRRHPDLPYIPILLITAHDPGSDGLTEQADGFLRKPFEIDALLDLVESLLSRERSRTASHQTTAKPLGAP